MTTRRGESFVWVSAAALTVCLLITALLIYIVLVNGLGYFWPSPLVEADVDDGSTILGSLESRDQSATGEGRRQFKVGNRDWYGADFVWVEEGRLRSISRPSGAVVLERIEHGNFYGYLERVDGGGIFDAPDAEGWEELLAAMEFVRDRRRAVEPAREKLLAIGREEARLQMAIKKLEYRDAEGMDARLERLASEREEKIRQFERVLDETSALEAEYRSVNGIFRDASGRTGPIRVDDIVRAYRPNQMTLGRKVALYFSKAWELLTDEPRESNTEGGLFPAIFGTVFMVFLMSIFCVPLGVLAAVYLHEYAKGGVFVRIVRIAVNNLAGVPSIVYGIFGLGFFVYGVGGRIDDLFFAHLSPEPIFGTGGVLWASLALALMTVPVVIVSTEEGLAAIPSGIREGSLGLGATRFQTLTRTVLPMASPGIMTGFVLSMARAAGEVAPLMLIGVVKLAPTLPIDGEFPFVHLDRKFMHLGFHVYDLAYQSPNVEAVRPMIYVTTLLLLGLVFLMSLTAILLRNHMRRKFSMGSF